MNIITSKQNRNRFITVRRDQVGGLGEKDEGIKQKTKKSSQTDNSLVIAREKCLWGVAGQGKGEKSGDEKRYDLGW